MVILLSVVCINKKLTCEWLNTANGFIGISKTPSISTSCVQKVGSSDELGNDDDDEKQQ